ncbi:citramalate synthase [Meiothermus granaticius]|uniref:Citramalate synthase n=1 Tax=Meiothermus granaticius NBRC 107808 TaxID=1227551 RepID=A0A399FCD0_9DEIN|nr:citramalate synthase [Meiothermus granaticius]RIH93898.1 (R)-citramalate synthase [Meiothermus granaticius NBRC 107808]GEM86394.1 citramalate synthase [Meiothermus granaticius NBRC 107808]
MIEILDTTLRDGTQGEAVSLSSDDKVAIAKRLAAFGVPIIEGGWPGSNPKDAEFFARMKGVGLGASQLCAFGSTRRKGVKPQDDPSVRAMLEAATPLVTVVAKSWDFHVTQALEVSLEENLQMIEETYRYLVGQGRRVIHDAEHFFDGYKANRAYALATLEAAVRGGADTLCLCDTNGGSLPEEVYEITKAVREAFPGLIIGIHPHNDGELAVANALAAIRAGATHVQGTINGYGERCGNLNLTSTIPNLILKYGLELEGISREKLTELREVSHFVDERANLTPNLRAPYVGDAAFAHKGGIHVSAVLKNPRTYEHIEPEAVGNSRRVLVSDLSGRSNLLAKLAEGGVSVPKETAGALLEEVKTLEHAGYSFEGAEASFYLLAHRLRGGEQPFEVLGFSVFMHANEANPDLPTWSEATLRVKVGESLQHTAAESEFGPVSALDLAFRKAVQPFYPEIAEIELADYKVRILSGQESGTSSGVRVLIEMARGGERWMTVGASRNSLEASLKALTDGYAYPLVKTQLISQP